MTARTFVAVGNLLGGYAAIRVVEFDPDAADLREQAKAWAGSMGFDLQYGVALMELAIGIGGPHGRGPGSVSTASPEVT